MWHTSRGDRTLSGAEAKLVAQAVDTMVDALLMHVDDDLETDGHGVCQSGIAVFDALSPSQRIALLYDVTRHLLTATEATLSLSATSEAAVAAIFIEIRDQVAIEIDLFPDGLLDESLSDPQTRSTWRRRVLAAAAQVMRSSQEEIGPAADELELPDPHCRELSVWEDLVDSLAEAVLWDRDFEMAETFLDVDPGISRQRRRLLGIEEDYFTQVAPDPRPAEVLRLASMTREIVRVKPR
jgi:hypothetical protein